MRTFGLHPQLHPYLQAVLDHNFGLERCSATVSSVSSGKAVTSWEDDHKNEIVLEIPFAGQQLKWQFSFNIENFSLPPDILSDDDFFESQSPELVKKKVPSLGNWQPSDPYCFLNLLLELRELYQCDQIAQLKDNEQLQRCAFEYETLVSMGIVNASDLEIIVQTSSRGTTVDFFLQVDLDITDLPLPPPDPPRPLAVLLVTYRTQGETSVEIHIWDDLEALIGRTTIPAVKSDITLMDYVPEVQRMLQRKIKSVINDLNKRQHLFCAIAQLVEPAILDGDSESFSKLTFLLRQGDEESVCCIIVPQDFPENAPLLTINKAGQGARSINGFTYNSTWPYDRMARVIVAALCEESN